MCDKLSIYPWFLKSFSTGNFKYNSNDDWNNALFYDFVVFKLEFSSRNTHSCIKKRHKKTETRSISLYHIPSIWEIFFCDSFSVIFCSHSILETWAFFSASKKFKVNFVSLAKQWVFFMCQGTSNDFFYHIQLLKQSVYIIR